MMNKVRIAGLLVIGLLVSTTGGYIFKNVYAKQGRMAPTSFSMDRLKGKKNIVDMAVVGSGPAGLSAALYGARLGYNTLIISGGEPGGQLTKTTYVENWPGSKKILGQKIIDSLSNQAKTFGAEYLFDTVTNVDFSSWPYTLMTEEGRTIHAQTVVIATGATPRRLGVEGEQEHWGKGVTTCAICDAPFYKGKRGVVVGGGDSAAEEAAQLSAYAKEVKILVRKSAMRASHVMQKHIKAIPSIDVMYNVSVQKILGDDSGVTGVELKNHDTGEIFTMPTDGVFLAIGHEPNTGIFKGQLDLDKNGYIIPHNRSQETSVPGVFAAGDVEDKHYRQAGVAAGHGISAALDASSFLTDIGFNKSVSQELTNRGAYFDDFAYEHVEVPHLTTIDDFKKRVATPDSGVVVLDFYADYCPSCMQMLPVVDSVAAKLADDEVSFFKVDVNNDAAKDLVRFLAVPKVPYLIIFKNGERAAVYTTTLSRSELYTAIQGIVHRSDDEEEDDD